MAIKYKNGDEVIVQADYFEFENAKCLPHFNANEVAYISRYYGDGIETTTAANIVIDTDVIILYDNNGNRILRHEMTGEELKEMKRLISECDDDTDLTQCMIDYCRTLATIRNAV